MDKKTVLLLVPPSDKPHIRDFYCSLSSKVGYYWPVQDLVVLSGNLSKMCSVKVIDAIVLKMSSKDCLEAIASSNVDMIIAATGSATLKNDLHFLKLVKTRNPLIKIVVSSSIFMTIGAKVLEKFTFLDGALLDFTNNDAENFLFGAYDDIKNMFFRNGKIIEKCSEPEKTFSMAIPRHDLFLNKGYKIQLLGEGYFITTITSVGCPYKCVFCCAGNVKYRARETDNIIQEIKYVATELKIKNIFFTNPILFTNKESALKLLNSIIINKLSGIRWVANVRVDLLDEELISLMKKAGCRALLFGIESGDQDILNKYNKEIALSDSKVVFELCRKHKIITLAYFMLGFPEECQESINKTLSYIRDASFDYISVGFVMPDIGTIFRSLVIQENYCSDDFMKSWDSSLKPYIENNSFSEGELIKIRRKIYCSFYLRLGWIKRHLFEISFMDLIQGGLKILSN